MGRVAWIWFAFAGGLLLAAGGAAAGEYLVAGLPNINGPAPTQVVLTEAVGVPGSVSIHKGPATVATVSVPAGGSAAYELPSTLTTSGVYRDAAYRVDAGGNVVAASLTSPRATDHSSDASRLIPVHLLGTDHRTFHYGGPGHGVDDSFVVVAAPAAAAVTVTATATTQAGPGIAAIPAGGSATVSLRADDVLLVRSDGDLTGTRVRSTAPVAVFAGNECTWIGDSACDHIHEQVPPVTAAGT